MPTGTFISRDKSLKFASMVGARTLESNGNSPQPEESLSISLSEEEIDSADDAVGMESALNLNSGQSMIYDRCSGQTVPFGHIRREITMPDLVLKNESILHMPDSMVDHSNVILSQVKGLKSKVAPARQLNNIVEHEEEQAN
jgi:hypothetical protein